MKNVTKYVNTWCIILILFVTGCSSVRQPVRISPAVYLTGVMDQFHQKFWVYSDGDAAGNHFVTLARMSNRDNNNETDLAEQMLPPMNLFCTNQPYSGSDCIEASFHPATSEDWGAWYFMNGVLFGTDSCPKTNWGTYSNAGWNLSNATQLSFWAKGKEGGERVEFFAFGVGRDPDSGTPDQAYPDSSPKRSLGFINLSREWTRYEISLKGVNLQSVLGGFGWAANAPENSTRSISFYLDDIAFDLPRLSEPHFLVSFETQPTGDAVDRVLKNTAYTYDNALALMAFLAVGDQARARIIADAFVEAQQNDRYFQDGSLRNAYQGGDLMTPPGWLVNGKSRSVRLPGFTSDSKDQQCEWAEDTYNVSRDTGNIAWAMLGLLAYHEAVATPGEHTQYLESVEKLGDWVAANCADTTGTGGYTGGFNGWEGRETKKTYKATEHNIDLYAAFQRLYLLTGNELWKQRADMAKTFVLRMWDEQDGKFWAGTMDDGITINKSVVPLDIQAWALLALRGDGKPYLRSLDYAEKEMRKGGGYDFSEKPVDLPPSLKGRDVDGVWYEGTAHMAVAYKLIDKLVGDSNPAFQRKADELVMFLKSNQTSDGGIMACDKELWTGFYLSDGSPWLYYPRKHIGATAWLIFVETGVNPFWMEAKL